MSKPIADPGQTCPLHQKDVSKVCHKCPWFTQMRGQDPQSGQEVDQWACAVAFLPTLLVENARVSRGTSAAVEGFRNEVVRASATALAWADQRRRRTIWQRVSSPLNFLRLSHERSKT